MKRIYLLLAVYGWFLIASNLLGVAVFYTRLTDLPRLNTAYFIYGLASLLFGALFVWTYYTVKQAEEPGGALQRPEAERLALLRNWIISFVLFFEAVSSVTIWVLNHYSAGFTLINASVIFDVGANLVLLYFAVELLRGKNTLKQFFWTMVVYGVGSAAFLVARHHWYAAVMALTFAGYFMYAIKAPLTRKYFRTAHLIVLPLVIILGLTTSFFDNGRIPDLTKQQTLLQQQFTDETAQINSDFVNFSQNPNAISLQNMQQGLDKRAKKIEELTTNMHALEAEYQMQLPNINQQKALENLRFSLLGLDIHREQGQKLEDLIAYAQKLDLNALTEKQRLNLNAMEQDINAFSEKLTQLQFELSDANLN